MATRIMKTKPPKTCRENKPKTNPICFHRIWTQPQFLQRIMKMKPPSACGQNKPNLSRRSLLATAKSHTKPGWRSRTKPNLSRRSRSEAQIPAGELLEILKPGTNQTEKMRPRAQNKPQMPPTAFLASLGKPGWFGRDPVFLRYRDDGSPSGAGRSP